MNTCKTCRYFKPYKKESEIKYKGASRGRCQSDKFEYTETGSPPDALAYWDSEGYSAGFDVGEDFGCIHHAAIDVPKSDSAPK